MLSAVHVYKDYPPVRGGIERHVDVLTALLVKRGVRCEVLCRRPPHTEPDEERHGVRVRRCASPLTLASTPLPPALPWALRRSRASLVHVHYPWPPGEAAWLLGGRRRPLVISVHCEVIRYPRLARLLAPLSVRLLSAARCILVASAAMSQIPLLEAHRERVRVVPYGVDLEHFRPDPSAADPLPGVQRPRIIFVGRLRYYKGLPVLAAALARTPGVQLLIVGSGPARAGFEAALYTHGCRDRAHLLGDVTDDDLLRLLQTADAAVLPSTSRAEAFGLSIAEAQACGLPAVTTGVGTGTAQTVADGVSGRVVPPNDPLALAEGVRWCLEPGRAAARRAAARAHAEASLSAARMADAVRAVYGEVAEL